MFTHATVAFIRGMRKYRCTAQFYRAAAAAAAAAAAPCPVIRHRIFHSATTAQKNYDQKNEKKKKQRRSIFAMFLSLSVHSASPLDGSRGTNFEEGSVRSKP